jgi:uncharacterized membrane protein YtjA (UPF0391 family)
LVPGAGELRLALSALLCEAKEPACNSRVPSPYAHRLFQALAFSSKREEVVMLSWALTFFIVAIVAAVLGFTSIAGAAAGIAKILFFIFLVLTLVALVAGALRGRPPV